MEKKLPIGIEDFDKIRTEDFYYVDKTGLIRELLQNWGMVNLFTRPRRFGKSLNMSMFRHYFEMGGDKSLFDGLEISKEQELCERYMGKYPVISISLKGVKADTFDHAKRMLCLLINEETARIRSRMTERSLTDYQSGLLKRLLDHDMSDADLMNSLRSLSVVLYQYYRKKVIILIDEYDVPLDKAFEGEYYEPMVGLLRGFLEQALKTNESLYFAILTGCLRIAKESIFTGFNNFNVFSITDIYFDEYFGFTDREVKALLEHYHLEDHYEEMKVWYDGYRFGSVDVYCPWDVLNHCKALRADPEAEPRDYWSNTSGNAIVRRFVEKASGQTRRELEQLVAGECVEKTVRQELTYNELDSSIENLWSVLFMTGYLTRQGKAAGRTLRLVIPNQEIRGLFVSQIQEWFRETIRQDRAGLTGFCGALKEGNAKEVEHRFNTWLSKTISIRDSFVRKAKKENYYHGILTGLLGSEETWIVRSNAESGEGYSDILIEIEEEQTGIVIELKYAERGALEQSCKEAMDQIFEKRYAQALIDDGLHTIWAYGIACFKKRCMVRAERIVPGG